MHVFWAFILVWMCMCSAISQSLRLIFQLDEETDDFSLFSPSFSLCDDFHRRLARELSSQKFLDSELRQKAGNKRIDSSNRTIFLQFVLLCPI